MGYLHINNLHSDQKILFFKECYALEKLDGSSSSLTYDNGSINYHSGGASQASFEAIFDHDKILSLFKDLGFPHIAVHGEVYAGKMQKLACRYGKQMRFAVFDIHFGDEKWVNVTQAEILTKKLGLEFVHYVKCSTNLEDLERERDAPSVQAKRNGVEGDQPREGVILRPLIEMYEGDGTRVIAKFKTDAERETASPRRIVDPSQQAILSSAEAIADEWCVPKRLEHVLNALASKKKITVEEMKIEDMREVLAAMLEDVFREAAGEVIDSREARNAVSKRTSKLYTAYLKSRLV